MGRNAPGSGWVVWLALLVSLPGGAADVLSPKDPLPERVYLSFLKSPLVQIPGRATGREFLFRLPEHVRFGEGSELHLVLRGDRRLWRALCSLRVLLNDRVLFEGGPGFGLAGGPNEPVWRLSLPVEPRILERDWNRVTLRFLLCKPEGARLPPPPEWVWEMHDADSFFTFVYERLPLFPELRRFPDSLVEEELLRMPFALPGADGAAVAVLVPPRQRDIHRRAVVLLGACLGRPGYVRHCQLGVLSDWETAARERPGLVVGLREELEPGSLPEPLRKPLAGLTAGQGLLAEHIVGEFPRQRRWIFVAGADDAGLEKALQTLVCPSALLTVLPNPSVIETAPSFGASLAQAGLTGRLVVPIRAAGGEALSFRGIYDTEQTFLGWQLPPGRQTDSGGYLELVCRHSTNLLAGESFLETLVQGQSIGRMRLTPETAAGGRVRLELPADLNSVGPVPVVFRAHLDVPRADCDSSIEDEAWLTLGAESRLVCPTAPAAVNSLTHVQTFLLSDPHLSGTLLLVPASFSVAELNWLLDFGRQLGQRFSFLDTLWPDVRSYGPKAMGPIRRGQARRVLLLGSVWDWPLALPGESVLLIRPGQPEGEVRLQGRPYRVSQFEPSLGFLHLVGAPGLPREKMLVAGGWRSGALPVLSRMLVDPDSHGRFQGVVCAMDAAGRSAAYDPRDTPRESFAEFLLRNVPPGLTAEETVFERFRLEARARSTAQLNFAISIWLGVLLLFLAGGRVWLLWERSRIYQQRHRHEHD